MKEERSLLPTFSPFCLICMQLVPRAEAEKENNNNKEKEKDNMADLWLRESQ